MGRFGMVTYYSDWAGRFPFRQCVFGFDWGHIGAQTSEARQVITGHHGGGMVVATGYAAAPHPSEE